MDLIMSAKQKNSFWSHCEGEVGVARERRLVSEYSKHGTNEYTLSSIASSDLAVHTYLDEFEQAHITHVLVCLLGLTTYCKFQTQVTWNKLDEPNDSLVTERVSALQVIRGGFKD